MKLGGDMKATISMAVSQSENARVYYPSARAELRMKLGTRKDRADKLPTTVLYTLPKSVSIHRNRLTEADAWEMTFDERDCPFDPDFVRAGAVSIWLYNEPSMLQKDRLFDRSHVVPDKGDGNRRTQEELRREQFSFSMEPTIVGSVDDVERNMGSDGRFITMRGQDYTDLFLRKQWPPTKQGYPRRVPVGVPINKFLADALREVDSSGAMYLDTERMGDSFPKIPKDGVNGGKLGLSIDSGTSYWDVMVGAAKRCGLLLYIDGLRLVLEPPRSEVASEARKVFHLAWGSNIENISVTRQMELVDTPGVVFRGYDPVTRKVVEVVYPPSLLKRGKKNKSETGINEYTRTNFEIVPMLGTTDIEALKRAAKARYTDLSRAERVITLSTSEMYDSASLPINDVRAGDAMFLAFDDYNREMLANPNTSDGEKLQMLLDRDFSADAAAVIVANYRNLEAFERPLFIREASLDYSNDNGFSVEMELVDFIELKDEEGERG